MHYIHYPMADVLTGRMSGVHDAEAMQIQRPDGSRVVVIVNIAPIDDDKFIVARSRVFAKKP